MPSSSVALRFGMLRCGRGEPTVTACTASAAVLSAAWTDAVMSAGIASMTQGPHGTRPVLVSMTWAGGAFTGRTGGALTRNAPTPSPSLAGGAFNDRACDCQRRVAMTCWTSEGVGGAAAAAAAAAMTCRISASAAFGAGFINICTEVSLGVAVGGAAKMSA